MKKIQMLLATIVVMAVAFSGCGNGAPTDDTLADISIDADLDISGDVAIDVAIDTNGGDLSVDDSVGLDAGDTAGDNLPEDLAPGDVDASDIAELPPPDASFVFEVRTRETCVADGPWKVDFVQRFRDSSSGLTSLNLAGVVVSGGGAWVVSDDGLYRGDVGALVDGGSFTRIADPGLSGVDIGIAASAGGLLVVADGRLIHLDDDGVELSSVSIGEIQPGPMVECGGNTYLVSAGLIYLVTGDGLQDVTSSVTAPVIDVACSGTRVVVAASGGIWERGEDGVWLIRHDSQGVPVTSVAIAGGIAAFSDGDSLALADTSTWNPHVIEAGVGGLPVGGIADLTVSVDGALIAVAHATGVTVINRLPGDVESLAVRRVDVGLETPATMDHFHSMRWLPSDTVNDIAFDPVSNDLWVATPAGLSRIHSEPTMLSDKADRMFGDLNRWFWRLGGFVSAQASFESATSVVQLPLRDDDNDGQWTQEAVGAFCYAYRVTGDERWYQAANRAITNMALQIDIPAQDFVDAQLGRGFITRSFVRDDEGEVFTSKSGLSNWHLVDYMDGHQYYWKDDTSSDELTGHFYGFSIYYDLCAKDDVERTWVAEHLTALVGYILGHGLLLLDLDGLPTEHGKYAPEYLAVAVDGLEACSMTTDLETCIGSYFGGAFLDSTEILAGLLAAWHVSGDIRFYEAYETLIQIHRYDELATFHDDVLTWTNPQIANYCDHELSDLAFLTLIRYEPRADRRQKWIDSMMAAWEHEVGERNPLKTLAMAAVRGEVPGAANGVSTLVDYPEDLRDYLVDNSHRVDVGRMGKDRFETAQFDTVLPYDEIHAMRWDVNPYRVVDGGAAQSRRAPNFWLLPYWGLRYYGVICD